jgi:hypothetical protein
VAGRSSGYCTSAKAAQLLVVNRILSRRSVILTGFGPVGNSAFLVMAVASPKYRSSNTHGWSPSLAAQPSALNSVQSRTSRRPNFNCRSSFLSLAASSLSASVCGNTGIAQISSKLPGGGPGFAMAGSTIAASVCEEMALATGNVRGVLVSVIVTLRAEGEGPTGPTI